jgi:kynureninase
MYLKEAVSRLLLPGSGLFDYLMDSVITDWREPNVIQFAPVPLYCSFEDMYDFGQILKGN